MKRCLAYVRDRRAANAWRPRAKPARKRGKFCTRHEQVMAGVILGICAQESAEITAARKKYVALTDLPVASKRPS